jgi:putative PIN family toxin of toxin-antitoxin system
MKRAVLDTNIIVSSALGGALVLVLEKWDQGKFTVIVTTDILDEYFQVISRPKFRLKQETIDKITRYIYQFSEFVVPEERIHVIEADPKDDKFLEAAIAGKVDFIVSGDNHLLELKEFRSIPIISGREFLDWLESNG